MPFVLALDSGSQSSRALIFDERGAVHAHGQISHAAMRRPLPEAVEQDPLDIDAALTGAIRIALDRCPQARGDLVGAALTTQRNAIVPIAEDGQPAGDLVSWLDRRQAPASAEPSTLLRTALHALGPDAIPSRLLARSVPRILRATNATVAARATTYAPIEAFLHHRLCGRLAAAPGGFLGVWPFDAAKRRWGPALLRAALAFPAGGLPDVVEAGALIGRIHADAAARTGLPEGLPLFACGGDKQAEALGAGVRPGDGSVGAVSLGTGCSVSIPWARPVQSIRFRWLLNAGAEPSTWSLEAMVFRGFWTARWFAEQLGRDLIPEATRRALPVEALLADEAAAVPAGAEGLLFLPRLYPGLDNPMESGTFVGLRDFHTRAHLFRAVVEGICFDLRRGLEVIEARLGTRTVELRVGGGGARSTFVVEVLRDVMGRPVRRPPSEELAARGAAMVAFVGSGHIRSMDDAVRALVPDAPLLAPDPKAATLYDARFRRAFLPALDGMQPVWSDVEGAVG